MDLVEWRSEEAEEKELWFVLFPKQRALHARRCSRNRTAVGHELVLAWRYDRSAAVVVAGVAYFDPVFDVRNGRKYQRNQESVDRESATAVKEAALVFVRRHSV